MLMLCSCTDDPSPPVFSTSAGQQVTSISPDEVCVTAGDLGYSWTDCVPTENVSVPDGISIREGDCVGIEAPLGHDADPPTHSAWFHEGPC